MSLDIDKKYTRMLPIPMTFKSGKGYANFRCIICGDSKKSLSKKRGWFLADTNNLTYHCHNCGHSERFSSFLKFNYPYLYDDYIKEILSDSGNYRKEVKVDLFDNHYSNLNMSKIKELPTNHEAIQYIKKRQIPLDSVLDCYYSDNFYSWCKEKNPEEFKFEYKSDKRIIFPFKERNGNIYGANGRSIENVTPKYLSIKFKEIPKVYGLDTLNIHKDVNIVEGPIDSTFIPNCLAMSGAMGNLDIVLSYCNLYDKNQITVIPDNERRNKYTCNFISNVIDLGYNIILWPEYIKEKDVNDMVIRYGNERVLRLIKENKFQGMLAKLRFSTWRKIK